MRTADARVNQTKHFHVSCLSELLGEEVLRIIATGLSQMTGRPLGFLEENPNVKKEKNLASEERYHYILPESPLFNYCNYCSAIQNCEAIKKECYREEVEILRDLQDGKGRRSPYWRICQFGLVDFTFPVFVNKQIMGVFFVEQFRLNVENSDRDIDWKKKMQRKIEDGRRRASDLYKGSESILELFKADDIPERTTQEFAEEKKRWFGLSKHVGDLAEERYASLRYAHDGEKLHELITALLEKEEPKSEAELWETLSDVLDAIRNISGTEMVMVLSKQNTTNKGSLRCVSHSQSPKEVTDALRWLEIPSKLITNLGREISVQMSEQSKIVFSRSSEEAVQLNEAEKTLFSYLRKRLSPFDVRCFSVVMPGLPSAREQDCAIFFLNRAKMPGRMEDIKFSGYAMHFIEDSSRVLYAYIQDKLVSIELRWLYTNLRDNFAAQSHKINAFLQSIFGKIYAVSRLTHQIERNEGIKQRLFDEIEATRRTLNRLKDLGRIVGYVARGEIGELALAPKKVVRIDSLTKDCVEDLTELANSYGSRIVFEAEKAEAPIDDNLIFIAIVNLLDNAIKYSFCGENITIKVWDEEGFVKVQTSNYGVGVPPNQQNRVFERYWRANVPYGKKAIIGTGIGLTVVKLVAEAHQGEVKFVSRPAVVSDKYKDTYTQEDIERGFCYTTEVTFSIPRNESK